MTLGTFIPLITVISTLYLLLMVRSHLAGLPTRADPGYDEAAVDKQRRAMKILAAASLPVPALLYLAVNVFTDTGTIVLF